MTNLTDTLFTKRQTAKTLAISLRHLDNLLSSKAIECIRIGRSVRFSQDAIQHFKQSRTVKAHA